MKSPSTELSDRVLRFDGVSIIQPDRLAEALARGVQPASLRVTSANEEIDTFNQNVGDSERIEVEVAEPVRLDFSWQLPEPHLSMDLEATVVARAVDRLTELNYPQDLHLLAAERIQAELEEIRRRGMVEFMKTIIYILDVFKREGVVWGVGRGSSCASYVLFILGLHSVDCILHQVPLSEFFHD